MKDDADRTDWPAGHEPTRSLTGFSHALMLARYIEELARVEEMFALSVAESGANIDVAKELWDIAQTLHTAAYQLIQLSSVDASKATLTSAGHFIHSSN